MNSFIRLTLSRILTPLCKPVQPHRLAAFEWSTAVWDKADLAANPEKAALAAKAAQEEEQAAKEVSAAQKVRDAVGEFGL